MNKGLTFEKNPSKAEIIIVNSCSVTEKAGAKTRYTIRKLKKDNINAFIVLCGCFVNTDKDEISKLDDINIFLENSDKDKIYELLSIFYFKRPAASPHFFKTDEDGSFNFTADRMMRHARAFIKIQDGCNNFCSFCKIPYARGRERSRDINNILNEITYLRSNGFEEFVLSGINIGSYDFQGKNINELLEMISTKFSDIRFRISSIEPQYINEQFLKIISKDNICPHFHIPLQNGSNKILSLMNRRYKKEEYFEKIEKIRHIKKEPFISTDIIFGFPGEDENDFNESIDFIMKTGFSFIHLFTFSPNTLSASKDIFPKVPEKITAERMDKARVITSDLNFLYRKKFINQNFQVLIERADSGIYTGKSENYINIQIKNPDKNLELKKRYYVTLTEVSKDQNFGILTR